MDPPGVLVPEIIPPVLEARVLFPCRLDVGLELGESPVGVLCMSQQILLKGMDMTRYQHLEIRFFPRGLGF